MTNGSVSSVVHESRGETLDFLGLNFDRLNENEALLEIQRMMVIDRFSYVVTPNVDHIVQLAKSSDDSILSAYLMAQLVLCDSRILSLLSDRSGIMLEAVPGSDLTRSLLSTAGKSWRLTVVGGSETLHMALRKLYPNFSWTFYEPPMGVRHDPIARRAIAEFIENGTADLIFFAIGAPQSEITCHEIAMRGRAKGVALCIGASLEFLAGEKRRAPNWMQKLGLEWLYRLGSEPGRLWRRYLIEGPRIFIIWWRWNRIRVAHLHAASCSNRFDEK
ncbi:MAG: WecB/TagA/CpsF family glycosyltransferase [Sphingorhabdus sp.]